MTVAEKLWQSAAEQRCRQALHLQASTAAEL